MFFIYSIVSPTYNNPTNNSLRPLKLEIHHFVVDIIDIVYVSITHLTQDFVFRNLFDFLKVHTFYRHTQNQLNLRHSILTSPRGTVSKKKKCNRQRSFD